MEFVTSKRIDKWIESIENKVVYLVQQQVNSLFLSFYQVAL